MYGESVFTTLRMIDGVLQDWDLHFDRLKKSVEFVYGPFQDDLGWVVTLKKELEKGFDALKGDKVIRATLFLGKSRGLIKAPLNSILELKIDFIITEFDKTNDVDRKYKLRSCPVNPRPHWWPAFLKSGNYLETILTQKKYLEPQDDDLLFVSSCNTILESSVANIFVVRGKTLYTSPVGPNVLDGVMRKKVIAVARDYFDDFFEVETSMAQLQDCSAIFGTNSVRGLFLVDHLDDHEINYSEAFMDKFRLLRSRVCL